MVQRSFCEKVPRLGTSSKQSKLPASSSLPSSVNPSVNPRIVFHIFVAYRSFNTKSTRIKAPSSPPTHQFTHGSQNGRPPRPNRILRPYLSGYNKWHLQKAIAARAQRTQRET